MMSIIDERVILEGYYKEGMEKGIAKGRAEGILETARNLKQMGMPVSDIAKATDLSADEVEKL